MTTPQTAQDDAQPQQDSAQKQDPQTQQPPSEIEKLAQELEQMTELAKRTMADLQNMKRRQEEERSQIFTMANSSLIRDLLPIIDNLDRARTHMPNSEEEWLKGFDMSISQFHKVLNESGLKPIEALGQIFNPDLHEALAQGPGPQDTIIEELERGYILGNRVIRHTKVKVGNGET